ncbi:DNA-binding transcriptional regulator YiaG [Pseudarthrobacter sp. W1I19]|uniref:terminase small subunit n=1 Tax=Pseudarthrobacter sp. W1I19 TaxID=3042288 RepID=UPI0027809FCA|nr:terminase small subunit [Pseudarthrobacter sp. W1I19]MDQ0923326.1 DNA-binding transcriptional regulator YiaG [Pseudarthrobacter sp. W1I19]
MARPTKYTKSLAKKAQAYLDSCVDTHEVVRSGSRLAVRKIVKVPTVEGLALALNISRDTVYAWAQDKTRPEFSDTLERLQAVQADRLIQGGLGSEYKDSIVKLILSAKHAYIPKTETREVDDWDDLMNRAEEIDDADPDTETSTDSN